LTVFLLTSLGLRCFLHLCSCSQLKPFGAKGVASELDYGQKLCDADAPRTSKGEPLQVTILASPPPSTAAPDDTALAQFWFHLDSASTSPENDERQVATVVPKNTFLEMKNGTWLLGRRRLGSTLYIRQCYVDLYGLFAETVLPYSSVAPRFVLTGNPGIGKTLFVVYLLWRARLSGCTVVYEPPDPGHKSGLFLGKRYLLRPDGSCLLGSVNAFDFETELNDPKTWHIADAHAVGEFEARTVIVTSPRKHVYHEYLKQPGTFKYCMPVWSFDEIRLCWAVLYQSLDYARVMRLFGMWGGIPRMVLQMALDFTDEALKGKLRAAAGSCNLSSCKASIGEINGQDDLSHTLLHLKVEKGYVDTHVEFASKYVAEMMLDLFLTSERVETISFINGAVGEGRLAGLRGQLFEQYAHSRLCAGGNFRMRNLSTDSEEEVILPPRKQQYFEDVAHVSFKSNTVYYRPRIATFAAFDSIIPPDYLLQMTVSQHHPLKSAHITPFKNYVSAPKIVFVVPPDIYRSFTSQSYLRNDNKTLTKIPKFLQDAVQFVLCLPVEM